MRRTVALLACLPVVCAACSGGDDAPARTVTATATVTVTAPASSAVSSSSSSNVQTLSHVEVERYIERKIDVEKAVCNDGHDFPIVRKGDHFTCTAPPGLTFTVTITDAETGAYSVE